MATVPPLSFGQANSCCWVAASHAALWVCGTGFTRPRAKKPAAPMNPAASRGIDGVGKRTSKRTHSCVVCGWDVGARVASAFKS